MTDRHVDSEVEEKRAAYLGELYTKAMSGDLEAGGELSKVALGYEPARVLVRRMDNELLKRNASMVSENADAR